MKYRNYICFNPEIKQKIKNLVLFINKYKWKANREPLLNLMYTLETLLYADYNRTAAVDIFLIETKNARPAYEKVENLLDKRLKEELKECVEYFESIAVALKLSKGGN